jgi:hypothetical protein
MKTYIGLRDKVRGKLKCGIRYGNGRGPGLDGGKHQTTAEFMHVRKVYGVVVMMIQFLIT